MIRRFFEGLLFMAAFFVVIGGAVLFASLLPRDTPAPSGPVPEVCQEVYVSRLTARYCYPWRNAR